MRNPDWTQDREFHRGEVFFVDLPEEPVVEPDPARVMKGPHRCVVLFSSLFPRKTVTVVPITSLYKENGEQKETIATDVILHAADYEQADSTYKGTISQDSFIRTEQIRTVSRHLLERKVGKLLPEDELKMDLRLIASLQLQDTVNMLIQVEIERRGISTQQPQKRQAGGHER